MTSGNRLTSVATQSRRPGGTAIAASVDAPIAPGRKTAPTRLTAPDSAEPRQSVEHLAFADPERLGEHRVRLRHQREVALELVEEPELERGHRDHIPIFFARHAKKIPLGLFAGSAVMRAKVAVS